MPKFPFDSFWQIVDSSVRTHYNHPDFEATQESELRLQLSKLTNLELYYFDYWSTISTYRMNRSALRYAAWAFFGEGEFSEDGFWYHCNWVTSLGSGKWRLALLDPDEFYSEMANEIDFPLRCWYDAGSFAYPVVLEEFEKRDIIDVEIEEMERLIEFERQKSAEKCQQDFPKIRARLEQYRCEDFDPFDCALLKLAETHWECQATAPDRLVLPSKNETCTEHFQPNTDGIPNSNLNMVMFQLLVTFRFASSATFDPAEDLDVKCCFIIDKSDSTSLSDEQMVNSKSFEKISASSPEIEKWTEEEALLHNIFGRQPQELIEENWSINCSIPMDTMSDPKLTCFFFAPKKHASVRDSFGYDIESCEVA